MTRRTKVTKTAPGGISFGDRSAQFRDSGTYALIVDGKAIATVRNEGRCGYMDAAAWRVIAYLEDGRARSLAHTFSRLRDLKAWVEEHADLLLARLEKVKVR